MHARGHQLLFDSDVSGDFGVVETSDIEKFESGDHKSMIIGRERWRVQLQLLSERMHARRHQFFFDTKFIRNFSVVKTVGAGKLEDSS